MRHLPRRAALPWLLALLGGLLPPLAAPGRAAPIAAEYEARAAGLTIMRAQVVYDLAAPGGRIVIDTPNLDSKLLDLFGPTWSQWQAPYHRTLLGRRGLRKLARRGSFRVERLRTRTHPLAAVKSVQQ